MRKRRIEKWQVCPMKGSKMTVVTEETTNTVTVTEPPTYSDSDGNTLKVGDLIRVSEALADEQWNEETESYAPARAFDFGDVVALNEDGTVQVAWTAAGCGCGGATSRTENPSDLSVATENELTVYYRGVREGNKTGRESVQEDIRYALGLNK
jgi:hypothetical protein